ncbi:MAG: PQQ-binding-like beta-propeller repeat protein, partial [Thermoplasmata archaeon]|nr:PQQ-binding-like beta-propeller repeat protein [Thermoplasmata archaeon]
MNQKGLAVGLILLFIVSIVAPMVIGNKTNSMEKYKKYNLDSYHISEIYDNEKQFRRNTVPDTVTSDVSVSYEETASPSNVLGPMDSAWPMYCHDTHHTGRSPYSTADNPPGVMKWSFETHHFSFYGSTVIDSEGIIYTAAYDLYAIYPNETLKWQFSINGRGESCPAIDENGIIYIGTSIGDPNYFYAVYPNGTMKWRYWIGGGTDIKSSPVIGSDGTIYFGCGQSIVALFPNGTLRWQRSTNHVVYSSPAISDDGTVYCGCHDTYLYALYSNNGTVKWMFKTGDWIRVSPCIADDGTIYCVSIDGYLYAIRPNGTMKWRTWVEAGTSPTIGQDGTIYAGWSKLYAVNPNGSVKWIFNSSGAIQGGTPCTSQNGTIYFGTSNGYLIAVNPDGTEQWRAPIGQCESAPAIGEDGTIYIGSMDGNGYGNLNAVGRGPLKAEANGPYTGVANKPVQLTGTIFGGIPPYICHWDFGDGNISVEQSPKHTYSQIGNFTATFTVTDSEGNHSSDTAQVTVIAGEPSVTITKPVNGIYLKDTRILPFPKPFIIGLITIQVDATQEPYGIDRVEFFIDGTLKATDTTAPYTWTWDTPAFFKHTITAVA